MLRNVLNMLRKVETNGEDLLPQESTPSVDHFLISHLFPKLEERSKATRRRTLSSTVIIAAGP